MLGTEATDPRRPIFMVFNAPQMVLSGRLRPSLADMLKLESLLCEIRIVLPDSNEEGTRLFNDGWKERSGKQGLSAHGVT